MQVQSTPDLALLRRFCETANRESFRIHGRRNTCVVTSAALMDVLREAGYDADVLRVTARVGGNGGCILGGDGDGTRRPAAAPGMWHGHLAVIVAGRFLLDPTLDQANEGWPELGAEPFTGEIPPDWLLGGYQRTFKADTGTRGAWVRYYAHPGRGGYKSSPAFRQWQRRPVRDAIIAAMREV